MANADGWPSGAPRTTLRSRALSSALIVCLSVRVTMTFKNLFFCNSMTLTFPHFKNYQGEGV